MRVVSVRSRVLLTIPFGANFVSSASEMTFSFPGSIKGFSLMSRVSHGSHLKCLMQVKQERLFPGGVLSTVKHPGLVPVLALIRPNSVATEHSTSRETRSQRSCL